MIRFRSFRASLLTLFLAVVATAQIATYVIVATVNRREADREIDTNLRSAAAVFDRVTDERISLLALSAQAVASDYAFRRLFFESADDSRTLQSAFVSASDRIHADFNAWVDLDGITIAASETVGDHAFTELVFRADESASAQASGYAEIDGRLFSVVTVPIRAPAIVGWWVVGFHIDSEFARNLRQQTAVDVSFANRAGEITATSLATGIRGALVHQWRDLQADDTLIHNVDLAGDASKVNIRTMPTDEGGRLSIILQYSLDEKLAPARRLSRLILLVSLGGVVLAGGLGWWFAGRLSQPVQELAAHTAVIASGDYDTRLELGREDELGDLARAFNAMSSGLAERDQVRDLLDKNVSPEVAAELMREGAALGGEEREVTILFADLRGFTTLSEKLPPREVVTLLNRYLDRMSQAIESAGGVIDKFIGDEIMALFGAPVTGDDAARRAVDAALAMRRALTELNTELQSEGHAPLAFGIGINTAPVIAGNIGSHRRLNYSVIGDGVNLASRLQSLTRNPAFATDLIVSEATLQAAGPDLKFRTRDLGVVGVKGRSEGAHIHAVDDAE
ncbi:adenylate/guanylate cyclase domain-containing protein [Synoicihabitans lomoniglobus]|uniref:Adenylate/guanylate cyclase domain-containing protein n=1 Tax=Synoicihabitans lomoniglobus TaxID=2909285 RepID=A0AAF0A167_9BACT|nr:adenylate/guanylate cyclase domain-containing protein [Opitutaceae bacterium LMO-M01]WED64762.1 adenylate/guanylate cyclase domain-containing protein [Opitutaceae bacterium LMO-M01]